MTRVRHRIRREGGITVCSSRYDLDDQGIVEVTPEHAALLVQGKNWSVVATAPEPEPLPEMEPEPLPEPEPEPMEGSFDVLTAELETQSFGDLVEIASALGLKVDRRSSKNKLIAAIRAARKKD